MTNPLRLCASAPLRLCVTLSPSLRLCDYFDMANRRRRRVDPRDPAQQGLPVWRWRTLPVWLAVTGSFVVGWYVAAFSVGWRGFDNFGQILVPWLVLMAFSLGLSRVV